MSLFLNPVFFFTLLFILSLGFILGLRLAFSNDKKAEETLKKAISDRDAFEKELKNSYEEVAKINQELSLKTQMLEGLKGQYAELEKDYAKLAEKAQQSDLSQPKNTQLQSGQESLQTSKPDPNKT